MATIDLHARPELGQRPLVVQSQHRDRAVVDRIARRGVDHRTQEPADRMPDERPELGVHHGVDHVASPLLPFLVELFEAERPASFLDASESA